MVDRWAKGSRPARTGRGWLTDSRGRPYRLGNTVAFHVYFQPAEGKLWNRLYRDGMPLRLSALVSRAEFVEEVGNRDGAYQLQPVDAEERPIGDPPSMVFLPSPQAGAAGPVRDPIMSPRAPELGQAEPGPGAVAAPALAADEPAVESDTDAR